MSYRFNPPPGWPTPPSDWSPPEGWQPDPSWPTPPQGWQFWVEDTPAAPTTPTAPSSPVAGAAAGAAAGQAWGPTGGVDPTTQIPTRSGPAYPPAPAPYSGETQQLSFGASGAPVYNPGGYAGGPGQPGSGVPGGPGGSSGFGGPGGPGEPKKGKGPLIAIIAGGAVVLVLVIVLLANLFGGGDDDPSPAPTSADAPTSAAPSSDAPSDEPSSAAPTSAAPTSAAPTTAPTQDAPAGATPPAGSTAVAIGAPFAAPGFDDEVAANVTLTKVTWDAECNAGFGSGPEGRYIGLEFQVEVPADATEAFSMNGYIDMTPYSDSNSLELGDDSLFCNPDNALPDDIQPGATVSGVIVLDVPAETTWIVYDPTWGLYDSAAWRIV